MKRFLCVCLCITLVCSLGATAFATDLTESQVDITNEDKKIYSDVTIEDSFADNRVLVVLKKDVGAINKVHNKSFFGSLDIKLVKDLTLFKNYKSTEQREEETSDQLQLESVTVEPLINHNEFRQILLLELPIHSKEGVIQAIKKLEQIDGIKYAGPDYTMQHPDAVPSDSYYTSKQWNLRKIQMEEAWEITTGSSEIRVGVIDTGIAYHPDLNDNVVGGWDFINQNSTARDDADGHGTHVAGIIAAKSNNDEGIAGVAWNVKLVPLQIYAPAATTYVSTTVEAITYGSDNNIPILNYSSSTYDLTTGESRYDYAMHQTIANYQGLFVCAAGNRYWNITENNPYYSPSYKTENLISVANSTQYDGLYSSSNYGGNIVHLAAPGDDIYSCYLNSEYESLLGTSMAAPHVAGVAALIMSIRPDLSPLEVKALILDNVDKVSALSGKCITGGRLNAYKAVRAATEAQTFTGDVNGDGRADVLMMRKISGKRALTTYLGKADGSFQAPQTTQSTRGFTYKDPVFAGDFNGDGKTDLVVHWASGGKRQLLTYISKGDGTFYEGANLASTRGHNPLSYPCTFHIGDVNGDGKDDFIVSYRTDTGYRYALVYKGKASSPYLTDATSVALTTTHPYGYNEPVYTGDFNGDNRTDLVVHWKSGGKRQLRVYAGTSSGTFGAGVNLSSTRAYAPENYPSKNFIADVNGDGKDDFVVHWKNGDGNRSNLVYLGKSASPYLTDATTNALTSTNTYTESDPVFVGDISGDGRADMIVHWANTSKVRQLLAYKATSSGTYNAGVNYATTNTHNSNLYAGSFFVDDVNGDGRDDIIVKWKDANTHMIRFHVYRGTAAGSFLASVQTAPTVNISYFT